MSDYMAAEITLGGPVPKRLVGPLCAAINKEGVSLQWGGTSFSPTSAKHLLAARCQDERGVSVLRLYAEEKPYGTFELLEKFLCRHGLSFRRYCDGKYEYDPEIIEYRPALGMVRYLAARNGEPHVPLTALRASQEAVAGAIALLGQRRAAHALRHLKKLLGDQRKYLPPEVPPLEAFEVVSRGRRA